MKTTVCIEMKDLWWDVVLMAVVDSMNDMKIDSPETFELWRTLSKAKARIQNTLDCECR